MLNTEHKQEVEELVQREDVKDSPFTIVTTNEGSFLTMGKYRLDEPTTLEEAREQAEKITWNRIIQVMMLVGENLKELEWKKEEESKK